MNPPVEGYGLLDIVTCHFVHGDAKTPASRSEDAFLHALRACNPII